MDGEPEEDAVLILTRRLGEAILVPSCGIAITVTRLSRGRVTLGIEAPPQVAVVREEIANGDQRDEYERRFAGGHGAGGSGAADGTPLPAAAGGSAAAAGDRQDG